VAVAAAAILAVQAGAAAGGQSPGIPGWKRITLPKPGLTLQIPASWQTRAQQGYELVAFDPAGDPVIGIGSR
jgi:hypothetical protein